MSLILEALKKIESDKSRNAKKADIAAAILQSDGGARRRKVLLISGILFSAAFLLIAAGVGISYLLIVKQQPIEAALTARTAPLSHAAGAQPTVAVTETPAEPSPESSQPSLIVVTKPAETSNARAKRRSIRDSEITEFDDEQSSRVAPRSKRANHAKTASSEIEDPTEQGSENLQSVDSPTTSKQSRKAPAKASVPKGNEPIKLTGIIWSDDKGKSRALVNGASVMEGDTIDGALIERIEQNRVRCSRNGKTFIVPVRTDKE